MLCTCANALTLSPNSRDTSQASGTRPPGVAIAAAFSAGALTSLLALCRSPNLAMFASAVKLLSHNP